MQPAHEPARTLFKPARHVAQDERTQELLALMQGDERTATAALKSWLNKRLPQVHRKRLVKWPVPCCCDSRYAPVSMLAGHTRMPEVGRIAGNECLERAPAAHLHVREVQGTPVAQQHGPLVREVAIAGHRPLDQVRLLAIELAAARAKSSDTDRQCPAASSAALSCNRSASETSRLVLILCKVATFAQMDLRPPRLCRLPASWKPARAFRTPDLLLTDFEW